MIRPDVVIELESGDVLLTVHPDHGGRLGTLEVGGRPILQDDPTRGSMLWGCYPMAPWAGRVRHGRFHFSGREERLATNLAPHAIHGTVFEVEWEVVDAGRDHCELATPLGWQFGGTAHQHVHLGPDGVVCVLTVHASERPMPAVIGWHPCFLRPMQHDLDFARMYRRDHEGITLPELVDPAPHPWDDCFVGPEGPLRLHHPDLVVTVSSDCDHWVVFDELDDIVCVEPQSGPPDAFNMSGALGGAELLRPGDLLQRHLTISWRRNVSGHLPEK